MKLITVYGGGYLVGDNGDVYNKRGKKLKSRTDGKGNYMQVGLCHKGKPKLFLTHRLVAIHFIDNPENKPEVNHIDGNKKNNNLSNLEWVTRSENKKHSYHVLGNIGGTAPMTGKFGAEHNRSKAIKAICLDGAIRVFGSASEMHRFTGCSKSTGSNILSKKRDLPYTIARGKAKGVVVLSYPHFQLVD